LPVSIYYSKFDLNTYSGTPYFRAHCPADYPLNLVLQKCRAFRRLPPRLRELSAQAKRWAAKNYPAVVEELRRWYDAEGRELDPQTGRPLTHAQIDAQWAGSEPPDIKIEDIPAPEGGFADPETWQPEKAVAEEVDDDRPTEAQLVSDIAGHGRERAARYYGVPDEQLSEIGSDKELAQLILQKRG
jgi:hypothetical protein